MQDILLTVEAVTICRVDIFMGTKLDYILDRCQLLEDEQFTRDKKIGRIRKKSFGLFLMCSILVHYSSVHS